MRGSEDEGVWSLVPAAAAAAVEVEAVAAVAAAGDELDMINPRANRSGGAPRARDVACLLLLLLPLTNRRRLLACAATADAAVAAAIEEENRRGISCFFLNEVFGRGRKLIG
jgi:hypothetical protein